MPCRSCHALNKKNAGFTLVEIIVGIVVLAISLSVVTSLIIPSEQHSVEQVHQIKAAELGQSMLNEILGKAFDEKSDKAGGRLRCDEDQGDVNTTVDAHELCTTNLTDEEADIRAEFDDVDDYNGYNLLKTSTDGDLHAGYGSFEVAVEVAYDTENVLQLGAASQLAKRITVTITTPQGTAIEFTGYKANF